MGRHLSSLAPPPLTRPVPEARKLLGVGGEGFPRLYSFYAPKIFLTLDNDAKAPGKSHYTQTFLIWTEMIWEQRNSSRGASSERGVTSL